MLTAASEVRRHCWENLKLGTVIKIVLDGEML